MRAFRPALLLLLVLLTACGGSERVMETGFLQKRKHLPGWDLSLPTRQKEQPTSTTAERPTRQQHEKGPTDPPVAEEAVEEAPEEVLASVDHTAPLTVAPNGRTREGALEEIQQQQQPKEQRIAEVPRQDPQEDLMPKKRWNRLAIPAFVASLAILALGLFSTSTIAVIVAILVTFVLSGISLRQIRKREEAGKGFAIIALIIALIASVATAMVTYVVGFV